jgi:hypothetical protein
MRSHVRSLLLVLAIGLAAVAVAAPVAQAAFGVEKFVAANCKVGHETCVEEERKAGPLTYSYPKEPTKAEAEEGGYTQAAGHPAAGITAFKVNTEGAFPNEAPGGIVTHVRTDVAPGVSTNPEAVGKCSMEEFGVKEVVPNTGFYPAPGCKPETEIGVNKVIVYAGPNGVAPGVSDLPLEGKTYNLVQPQGRSSDFGVALKLPEKFTEGALKKGFKEAEEKGAKPGVGGFPSLAEQKFLEEQQYYAHTLIEGGVEWGAEAAGTGKGDYHDYYEINVSPSLPLIASRLALKGNIGSTGKGGFITNPSNCAGPGPLTTNTVTLKSAASQEGVRKYTTPIGTEGCKGESGLTIPPFLPEFALTPETTQSDQPDGIATELKLPHNPGPEEIDTSQLKTATVTLPEGMTLNPSAAAGLEACTPAQARIHSSAFGVACPEKSKLGTVTLNVPTLPAGSLEGTMYLGQNGNAKGEAEPITGPPYTMYINAESKRYGVDVRLKGSVTPNETGQLTATFSENPEQPFSNAILRFNGGALAPLANPLACGTAKTETSLVPFTGTATQSPFSQFTVDANGKGGACPSPLSFALGQSTQNATPNAGAFTAYTLNLERADGQQYLSQVKTVLPPGLVGALSTVPQCPEAEANAGTCPFASQIGTATVLAGAGPAPYTFSGPVSLTGPYHGAPFGLSIAVPALAGPFSLGTVVTREGISIDPYTARVTVAGSVPTIVKGVPLRLRKISVAINRHNFLYNPTNCSAFATETTLTSTFGATQSLANPFQVNNCSALAFKPKFGAASEGKTSKAKGASLETTLNVPTGNANVKSVMVQLPKQLPSRLTTLQKACPEATFNANPYTCPSGSFVGGVRANTPTIGVKMKGPAILVSHGGRAFPDLDLLLEGEGVRVILVGNTDIKNEITTTTFASTPDVPVSSITVNLPIGSHSALTANGANLCRRKLVMPTTITAQNGAVVKQNTTIKLINCPVRIASARAFGHTAYVTVQTFAAGRISGKGSFLAPAFRHFNGPQKAATLKIRLSRRGVGVLRFRGRLKVRVRVGFVPKKRGAPSSVAYATVAFRR